MRVLGNLNLNKNQITVVSIEHLAADPTGGNLYEGRIWLNTTSDKVKVRTELGTIELGSSSDLSTIQNELDNTQSAAGLATNGNYTPPGGSNYLSGSTSIVEALGLLDTEIDANATSIASESSNRISGDSALQSELDVTQAGAGLNAGGTYTVPVGHNYLTGDTSIKESLASLDGQAKINADNIALNDAAITAEENARIAGDALKLNLAGGTVTGNINMSGAAKVVQPAAPSDPNDVVNKAYADSLAGGFDQKASCRVGTTTALPANTYLANVLTADANGALPDQDGITLIVNDRILVKNEATATHNGIYYVSAIGDVSNPWTLTRATDFDGSPSTEVSGGSTTYVEVGTTNASSSWSVVHDGDVVVDTDDINFTQIGGAGSYAGVQGELDATQVGAGLANNGDYVVNSGGNYIDTATSLADADNILDTTIGVEAAKVATNQSNISNLTTLADTHETAVGLNTNGTYAAPSGTNFLDDSTDVMNALVQLDTAIGSNSLSYHFSAAGAATSHPINHGLGQQYCAVTVIDKADNTQIIPDSVTFVDANNLTIGLATALNIAVVIVS